MKRFFIVIFVALCSFNISYAQNNSAKAKEILDAVSAKTKSYSTIKIDFSFIHETKNNSENKSVANGKLLLEGNKYQLELMGNILHCNGSTLWTHMLEEKEVTIQTISEDEGGYFNPAKMLTIYESGYKYKFIQERYETGRALYIIDLYPKDVDNSEFSRVRLTIDKDKLQIRKIEYFSKDENQYIIEVKTFETNVSIPASSFTFDKTKYPDVSVIDER